MSRSIESGKKNEIRHGCAGKIAEGDGASQGARASPPPPPYPPPQAGEGREGDAGETARTATVVWGLRGRAAAGEPFQTRIVPRRYASHVAAQILAPFGSAAQARFEMRT
jgi:hypothetical protein